MAEETLLNLDVEWGVIYKKGEASEVCDICLCACDEILSAFPGYARDEGAKQWKLRLEQIRTIRDGLYKAWAIAEGEPDKLLKFRLCPVCWWYISKPMEVIETLANQRIYRDYGIEVDDEGYAEPSEQEVENDWTFEPVWDKFADSLDCDENI